MKWYWHDSINDTIIVFVFNFIVFWQMRSFSWIKSKRSKRALDKRAEVAGRCIVFQCEMAQMAAWVMGGGGASCALQTHNSNAPLARRHNGCLTDISISGPPFSRRRKNEDETARCRTWRRRAPGDGITQTPAILLSTSFINFSGGPPGAGRTITRLTAPSSKICKAKGREKNKTKRNKNEQT